MDQVNSYSCICAAGYNGEDCENSKYEDKHGSLSP